MLNKNKTDLQNQENLMSTADQGSYTWPSRNQFSIIAFCPMPSNYLDSNYRHDQETVKNLMEIVKNSGIDTVLVQGGGDCIQAHLQAALSSNINVIASYFDICNPPRCLVVYKMFRGFSNLVAWQVMDEPKPKHWGGVFDREGNILEGLSRDTTFNALTVGYNLVNALDPSRTVMFNLAVRTSSDWIGKFSENEKSGYYQYMNYLRHLNILYHPQLWSFDYYPVACKLKDSVNGVPVENGIGKMPTDNELQTVVWYKGLFTYLQCFQTISQATGSRFIAYSNCMHYNLYNAKGKFNTQYPCPTMGKLRLEVFSAMCYGAAGIAYYRYGLGSNLQMAQKDDFNWADSMVCFESPVSYHGSSAEKNLSEIKDKLELTNTFESAQTLFVSDIWQTVRDMNKQIRLWQKLFIGSKPKNHLHALYPVDSDGNPLLVVGMGILTKRDLLNTCLKKIEHVHKLESSSVKIDDMQYPGEEGSYITTFGQQPGVLLSWFTSPGYRDGYQNYLAILNLDIERQQSMILTFTKGGYYSLKESKSNSISDYSFNTTKPGPNTDHVITLSPGEMIVLFW